MEIDYLTLPPPPEPLGTRYSGTGAVKWFSEKKGVGCVACEKTSPWDVWFHFSALEMVGFRNLAPGQMVEMEFERANQDSFRYRALAVRPV